MIHLDKVVYHLDDLVSAINSTKVYLILTSFHAFINAYIFSEWNFALGFFIIFIIDTWSGCFIAWRQKVFSFKVFRGKLLDKSVAYFSIIIAYSIGTKIVLNGVDTNVVKYLDLGFYNLFIVAELFSIIKNWYHYKQWPVLKKLMKHFEGFDSETGEKE